MIPLFASYPVENEYSNLYDSVDWSNFTGDIFGSPQFLAVMHLNCHGNIRKLGSGEKGHMCVDLYGGPLYTLSVATRDRPRTEVPQKSLQEWEVTVVHRTDEIGSNREP